MNDSVSTRSIRRFPSGSPRARVSYKGSSHSDESERQAYRSRPSRSGFSKPALATSPILATMYFEENHQRPNHTSQIILAESTADVNYPAVSFPFAQPLFEKIRNTVDVARQQRPLLQVEGRQEWPVKQPGEVRFVNALDVELRQFSPDRMGDSSGKVFVGQQFHARASRRRLSASCKSASISSG